MRSLCHVRIARNTCDATGQTSGISASITAPLLDRAVVYATIASTPPDASSSTVGKSAPVIVISSFSVTMPSDVG